MKRVWDYNSKSQEPRINSGEHALHPYTIVTCTSLLFVFVQLRDLQVHNYITMSRKDTDDVLDFINSLPESKRGTPKPTPSADTGDDLLDFLDELSAHEKAAKPSGSSRGKFEPKKKDTDARETLEPAAEKTSSPSRDNVAATSTEATAPATDATASVPGEISDPEKAALAESLAANDEAEITAKSEEPVDPIASISSWWNAEGSSKVSSLWGSLTSNAHQIGETTFQLASNTSQQLSHLRQKFISEHALNDSEQNIGHITNRLNLILSTMSQQIKEGLIDKEDELLNILLVHDLAHVNYLESECAYKFNKVMGQVEGGIKVTVNSFNHKHDDMEALKYYDLGMFHGKAIDGEKLCFANLESSIKDFVNATTPAEPSSSESREDNGAEDNEAKFETHDINKSNIFIAIQPITTSTGENTRDNEGLSLIECNNPESFSFTMILKDITNNITIISKTQPFPLKWVRWVSGDREDIDAVFGAEEENDSIDPSEWVKEWLKDGLTLCFGVIAQEYVTKRMGI